MTFLGLDTIPTAARKQPPGRLVGLEDGSAQPERNERLSSGEPGQCEGNRQALGSEDPECKGFQHQAGVGVPRATPEKTELPWVVSIS